MGKRNEQASSHRLPLLVAGGGAAILAAFLLAAPAKTAAPFDAQPTATTISTDPKRPAPSLGTRRSDSPRRTHSVPDVEAESTVTVVQPGPGTIHPRHAAIVEHLDRDFRAQARSEPWADTKEIEYRDFFATKPEARGSRLLSADCRSSLCRLRIAHNEPDSLERFLGAVGLQAPFAVAGARFPDPDEDHSVMFLAREDTSLPWPDPDSLPPAEVP